MHYAKFTLWTAKLQILAKTLICVLFLDVYPNEFSGLLFLFSSFLHAFTKMIL